MKTFVEGNLKISFPSTVTVKKFDDSTHGLSHCMKAVDFIVDLKERYLFIEFKDPQNPHCEDCDREKFISDFLAGRIDEKFKYKYRDSFLYEWASGRADKPIHYYVLVAIDSLTEAELLNRNDALRRNIPIDGPASGKWIRNIVAGCLVFNIESWNRLLPSYPVSRT